jgi:hypothetical protein
MTSKKPPESENNNSNSENVFAFSRLQPLPANTRRLREALERNELPLARPRVGVTRLRAQAAQLVVAVEQHSAALESGGFHNITRLIAQAQPLFEIASSARSEIADDKAARAQLAQDVDVQRRALATVRDGCRAIAQARKVPLFTQHLAMNGSAEVVLQQAYTLKVMLDAHADALAFGATRAWSGIVDDAIAALSEAVHRGAALRRPTGTPQALRSAAVAALQHVVNEVSTYGRIAFWDDEDASAAFKIPSPRVKRKAKEPAVDPVAPAAAVHAGAPG